MSQPTWILHVSDPHLGDVSEGQTLDDEKDVYGSQSDLETTQRVFDRTLKTLARFVEEHGRPKVAVVSGDITYKNRPKGFTAFGKVLTEHARVLPEDRSRIVVVPGNHDVDWGTGAGTPERYRRFLSATRKKRCCTPLLDGVDFEAVTGKLLPAHRDGPHVVETDDLLVVPINSSNWCGTDVAPQGAMTLEQWAEALEPIADASVREKLLGELGWLRNQDIPRVSRDQIAALGQLFNELGLTQDRAGDGRTRIAVLHHQLLPVSGREERKPYESIVNLGEVRDMLASYGFDIVLHGHKHESGMYWDLATADTSDLNAPQRRVLVISSPGHFDVNTPAMRAIILSGAPEGRNARICTFMGSTPHRSIAKYESQMIPLWPADGDRREQTTITATTAHACYSRLRSLYALRGGTELRNVVCQIAQPSDAPKLPLDYPPISVKNSQTWFDELVNWWQLDRSELVARGLMRFNHGERIRRRWDDQVGRAIEILNTRDESSRALIQLVSPRETGRYKNDERPLVKGSFPAFVLAEFSIIERDGTRYLDCFGYFRKQEMQYWWPINLAELARLQEDVRKGIKPGARTGRVVTFSAIALWKQALPRVAVPLIDLYVEEPGRLLSMAAAVAFPDTATPKALGDWRDVLRDLAGSERGAPPKVSAGVEILLDDLRRLVAAAPAAAGTSVIDALDRLQEHYEVHEDSEELPEKAAKRVAKHVEALTDAVTAALSGLAP
jgi:3',5'-cyclic AMP phosphodiesterase CpdA